MKTKNRSLIVNLLVFCLIIILGVRHFYIKDFRIIQGGILYVSDQPRGMDYARLAYKYHIASIINVRTVSEHLDQNWHNQEIVKTKTLGIQYVSIPIEDKDFPDIPQQKQFLSWMADKKNLPVLIHGYGDDSRVAMMVAAWLRCEQGYTKEKTIEVVRTIIDDRPLRENEIQYIEQLMVK